MNQRILPWWSESGLKMYVNRLLSVVAPVFVAIVLSVMMPLGTGLALAEPGATDRLVTHRLVERKDGVVVSAFSVQLSSATLQRVSLSPRGLLSPGLASTQLATKAGGISKQEVARSFFSNLMIERHSNHVVVSGWRALKVKPEYNQQSEGLQNEQLQRIFFQEVRITLPYSATNGGWDVRSLERELERLGVKVKPKPSLPRPAPQLRG